MLFSGFRADDQLRKFGRSKRLPDADKHKHAVLQARTSTGNVFTFAASARDE